MLRARWYVNAFLDDVSNQGTHIFQSTLFHVIDYLQHVIGQHQANPVMVQRSLPTTSEWMEMIDNHKEDWRLRLEYEPADPRSDRDEAEGYLAVLAKE